MRRRAVLETERRRLHTVRRAARRVQKGKPDAGARRRSRSQEPEAERLSDVVSVTTTFTLDSTRPSVESNLRMKSSGLMP